MGKITKETIIVRGKSARPITKKQVKVEATNSQMTEYVVYYFFGAIEILLGFRLVLKLMGASVSSSFVDFIYGVSSVFILPFEGIFRRGFTQGIETTSVLEPSTAVAIIVYIVLGWGLVKLIRIFSGEQQD